MSLWELKPGELARNKQRTKQTLYHSVFLSLPDAQQYIHHKHHAGINQSITAAVFNLQRSWLVYNNDRICTHVYLFFLFTFFHQQRHNNLLKIQQQCLKLKSHAATTSTERFVFIFFRLNLRLCVDMYVNQIFDPLWRLTADSPDQVWPSGLTCMKSSSRQSFRPVTASSRVYCCLPHWSFTIDCEALL